MKVRSRKTNRATSYALDDFMLKEFSLDKEVYIPDTELSCNECFEEESESQQKDSPLSFLVKFKGDNLSDPKAIKAQTTGFKLPDDLDYRRVESNSFFVSVAKNHYNLHIQAEQLKELGSRLYRSEETQFHFSKKQVNNYLIRSYNHPDWQMLYENENKTKWRQYMGRILKKTLVEQYGPVDERSVTEALAIDKAGFLALAKDVAAFGGFAKPEMELLTEKGLL